MQINSCWSWIIWILMNNSTSSFYFGSFVFDNPLHPCYFISCSVAYNFCFYSDQNLLKISNWIQIINWVSLIMDYKISTFSWFIRFRSKRQNHKIQMAVASLLANGYIANPFSILNQNGMADALIDDRITDDEIFYSVSVSWNDIYEDLRPTLNMDNIWPVALFSVLPHQIHMNINEFFLLNSSLSKLLNYSLNAHHWL